MILLLIASPRLQGRLQERIKFTESFEAVVQRAEAAEAALAALSEQRKTPSDLSGT